MTHDDDHHGDHHDHGDHHHHHHHHDGHHGQAVPGIRVTYSYLPTTVATPLLEPSRPGSRALVGVGVLTYIFCLVMAVVLFVLWL